MSPMNEQVAKAGRVMDAEFAQQKAVFDAARDPWAALAHYRLPLNAARRQVVVDAWLAIKAEAKSK